MTDAAPVIHSYHEYTRQLEEALSFIRCLMHLSPKSILPSPAERGDLRLDRLSTDEIETHVLAMFESAVQKLHGFSRLYVGFPSRF